MIVFLVGERSLKIGFAPAGPVDKRRQAGSLAAMRPLEFVQSGV